jgi:hypothetical protein
MPPPLLDYEYAFGETGYILNADYTGVLPFVDVTDVSGLDVAPQRVNTTEREGVDGTYLDNAYQSMRTVVITGALYTLVSDPDTICDLLRGQYGNPAIQRFYFKHPSKNLRFVNAQGGGVKYDIDTNRRLGITNLLMTLLCGDPYIYDYPASIASGSLVPVIPPTIGLSFIPNFLTGQNTGFEGGIGNWVAQTNCAVSDSALQAHSGTASMAMTSAASGTMTATSCAAGSYATQMLVAVPGDVVTYSAWLRAATSGRTCTVGINWYTSAGVFISSSTSGSISDLTSAWTQASSTGTAPATTAYAQTFVQVQSTAAVNEVHFVDDVITHNGLLFNASFGSTVLNAQVGTCTNNGTHSAYPVIQLNGPMVNPVITDAVSNITMALNLSLASTDSCVIDCNAKTIIMNGSTSVRASYQGLQWFVVPPQTTDTFFVSASSVTGSYTITVYSTYY